MITIAIIILALSVIIISWIIKTPPEPTTLTLTIESATGLTTAPVKTAQVRFGDTLENEVIADILYLFNEWKNINGKAISEKSYSAVTSATVNEGDATIQATFATEI